MMEPLISKFDIYRIVDPIFRVHARLFHLQFTFSKLLKIQSRVGLSISLALTGLFFSLLSFLVTYFKLNWKSAPVIISAVFSLLLLFLFILNVIDVFMAKRESKRLAGKEEIEDIESWVDYTKYVVAGYGTRLKLIKSALEENDYLLKKGRISKDRHEQNKELFEEIKNYCVQQLEGYKQKNEQLGKIGKRNKKDYEEVNRWIGIALK